MRKVAQFRLMYLPIFVLLVLAMGGCEKSFFNDGDASEGINSSDKYLYVIENGSKNLLMLDNNFAEIDRWDLSELVGTNDIRGIACNEKDFWISVSGSMDEIIQIASSGESIVVLNTMIAPPDGKGTIRDLTFDGTHLWALNSGSTASNIPGQIFKIETLEYTIVETYDLNISNARGITYVGENGDIYGRDIPQGLYITDSGTDKIYLFDKKTNFTEFFDMPLHPRGVFYTSPTAISFSGFSFYIVNASSTSGNYFYRIEDKGSNYNVDVKDMIDFPYDSPTAMSWTNSDFRIGVEAEILSIVPNTAKIGESVHLSIIGNGFAPDLSASFGPDISVSNLEYQNSRTYTADILVSDNASTGEVDVVLSSPSGSSITGASMFTIVDQNPSDGYVLYCDNNDGSINKINIGDSTLVDKWYPDFADPNSLQGIEYSSSSLWMSSGGNSDKIFELETPSNTVIATLNAPPNQAGTVREMTFDSNDDLWVLNSVAGKIYKLDKTNGSMVDSILTPTVDGGGRGIVFANDLLYCNDKDTDLVYVYNFTDNTWATAFEVPVPPGGTTANRYPAGMTWDGVNFWIANSTGDFDYLFQVSPSGALLRAIPVPNIGDAKISGVAFTY